MLCADKGTTRSAQALPEAEGAASVENSSGAYTTSPQDTPDSCDSASKQVLLKARGHRTSHQVRVMSSLGRSALPRGGGGGGGGGLY